MKPIQRKRTRSKPFILWILVTGLFIFSIGGWVRLFMAVQDWPLLQTLNLKVGPLYLAITGMVWGAAAVICATSLLLEKRWGIYLTTGSIILYSIWYWVDRLALAQSSTANTDNVFAILATIFWLLWAGAILFVLFQRTRRYNKL